MIAAVMSCASCAYYNTFFFANKYYKQAERARELRRDDKPTSQEIGLYEKCIRQCSKVISEYPDSKYVDDALFLMASSYYHWGRYQDSMDWYGQLQESYPQSEKIREARYMTALCHLALYEYVDAENILTEMLATSKGDERQKIIFSLAEVSVERNEMESAVRHLRSLLRENPSDELALEANLALGDAYFESGAYDSAAMSYEGVVNRSGKKEQRVEARKRMGQAWQASGDYETALDVYSRLLLAVESPPGAKARDLQEATLLLRMGECYNSLGEHERAIELFDRVMEDFQQTSVAAEAEYLKGYTYEIYYEDLTRAKTSYDRVPSHYQRSVFADQAAKRSEGIGKLMQYLEEGGTVVEEAEGQGAFLSAELNLFQLNKPEKALQIYRGLEQSYPESPLAPKAAYAAAWVLVNKLDREEEGMSAYRRIIEQYPYTDYADGARRILGMQPIAAQLQGPPLPKGWVPPDTSVIKMLQEGLPDSAGAIGPGVRPGAPGTAGGIEPSDTLLANAPPVGGPSDSTGAAASSDTAGVSSQAPAAVADTSAAGRRGPGAAAPDTSAAGQGNAGPPPVTEAHRDTAGARKTPADSSDGGGSPPDTTGGDGQ